MQADSPDPEVADELRDGVIRSRRAVLETVWDRGVARSELRADIDRDIAIGAEPVALSVPARRRADHPRRVRPRDALIRPRAHIG
ncbi:TetR/AcrR family transcriptional regulator C-terminal ligand-binding domain-containing protein [Mycolicibacterium sarraceniae]|nr:TetR/AcrR family transcriptional regulator C-terminal ligand-binding domain-containing protein [Mycolicibacterium sarraceniae]